MSKNSCPQFNEQILIHGTQFEHTEDVSGLVRLLLLYSIETEVSADRSSGILGIHVAGAL